MKIMGVISMIFDIILIAILAVTMVKGFRSGFVYTFIHAVGWLLAVVMGFVWSPKLRTYLLENTKLHDRLHEAFLEKFSQSLTFREETMENLPEIIRKAFDDAYAGMTSSLAQTIADVLFTTLCFVIVVAAAKLVLLLITLLFSKRNSDGGITSFTDGVLGLVAGIVHGILIIFFMFALLTVFSGFLSPEMSVKIADSLSESAFAKDFYDNNLLLLIVRSFLP